MLGAGGGERERGRHRERERDCCCEEEFFRFQAELIMMGLNCCG